MSPVYDLCISKDQLGLDQRLGGIGAFALKEDHSSEIEEKKNERAHHHHDHKKKEEERKEKKVDSFYYYCVQ